MAGRMTEKQFITHHVAPRLSKWEYNINDYIKRKGTKSQLIDILSQMQTQIEDWKRILNVSDMTVDGVIPFRRQLQTYASVSSYAYGEIFPSINEWAKRIEDIRKSKGREDTRRNLSMLFSHIQRQLYAWKDHVTNPCTPETHNERVQQTTESPQRPHTSATGRAWYRPGDVPASEHRKLHEDHQSSFAEKFQLTKMLEEQRTEVARLKLKVETQNNEIESQALLERQLKREKEEALTRLSEIAGRKLRENNPAITDLSTENRPTKIAEWYRELYDNQWTEAFAELTDTGYHDRKAIDLLVEIMRKSFRFTADVARTQLHYLDQSTATLAFKIDEIDGRARVTQSEVMSQSQTGPNAAIMDTSTDMTKTKMHVNPNELPSECTELLKQLLKASAPVLVAGIQQIGIGNARDRNVQWGKQTTQFFRECTEITWYMNVQTPPMVLDVDLLPGQPVPANKYNLYTQAGDLVEYVVWPACLLHEDGPLLAKGSVQGVKSGTRYVNQGDNQTRKDMAMDNLNSNQQPQRNKNNTQL